MMKRLRDCVMSWNLVVEVSLMLAARLTLLLNHLHQVWATVEEVYSEVSLQVEQLKVGQDLRLLPKNHHKARICHLI
jgi:hypothetical protein